MGTRSPVMVGVKSWRSMAIDNLTLNYFVKVFKKIFYYCLYNAYNPKYTCQYEPAK
jgi:hypothetical protein